MSPAFRKRQEQQRQLVIEWNRVHREGVAVDVQKDDGTVVRTKTRSAAWLMGEHSAMVLLDGISGGYSLERVTAVEPVPEPLSVVTDVPKEFYPKPA